MQVNPWQQRCIVLPLATLAAKGAPMRHIILFRHATAESQATSGEDFDRELSSLGQKQAESAARWLKEHLSHTPVILASTAVRTQQTARALAAQFPDASITSDATLYDANPAKILQALDRYPDAHVVMIGHNPGLEATLALLTTGQSSAVRGMTTAAIAWLTADAGALNPGGSELKLFWHP
jgi:phosphohistidine phosphatase